MITQRKTYLVTELEEEESERKEVVGLTER
jgi:hypothetical protein